MIQKIILSVSLLLIGFKSYANSNDRIVLKASDKKEELLSKLKKIEGVFQKFALSEEGELVISTTGESEPKHGSLASQAKSAGYIKVVVDNSGISSLKLNNRSGKFCPSYESLSLVVNFLRPFSLDKLTSELYYLPNVKKCVKLSSPEKGSVKENDLEILSTLPADFSFFRYFPDVYEVSSEEVKAELPFDFPSLSLGKKKGEEKISCKEKGEVNAQAFIDSEDLFSSQVAANLKREGYDFQTFFDWDHEGVMAIRGSIKFEKDLRVQLNLFAHYPRFSYEDDAFDDDRVLALMSAFEPFYKKYEETLKSSYKKGDYFSLKSLMEEGATEEILSLVNSDEMTDLIKEQKLSGSLAFGDKEVSFEAWVRVEELFKYLSVYCSLHFL